MYLSMIIQFYFSLIVINWIVSPLKKKNNLYVKALTPNVTVFGDRAFTEVIKVKWGHESVALIW